MFSLTSSNEAMHTISLDCQFHFHVALNVRKFFILSQCLSMQFLERNLGSIFYSCKEQICIFFVQQPFGQFNYCKNHDKKEDNRKLSSKRKRQQTIVFKIVFLMLVLELILTDLEWSKVLFIYCITNQHILIIMCYRTQISIWLALKKVIFTSVLVHIMNNTQIPTEDIRLV